MAASERAIHRGVIRAPGGACSFWFWSVPLAWITSALVLLAEEARVAGLGGWGNVLDFVKFTVFLFWFILARQSLLGIRSSRLGYAINKHVKLGAEVLNLFNRKVDDITYFYESQLRGEAAAVADKHFHPVEPRSLRLSAALHF